MIRLATMKDLPRLLDIYAAARAFMKRSGNPTQWTDRYPLEEDLREDICLGRLYGLEEGGRLCACFMLDDGPDPTYGQMLEGSWSCDASYGVIHRVASDGTLRGVMARCVEFAARRYSYLRIDTHEDNLPMQRALLREGFVLRGVIITHNGTPRLAYDRVK